MIQSAEKSDFQIFCRLGYLVWSSCCVYVSYCVRSFSCTVYSMLWAGKADMLRSAEKSDFQIFCRLGYLVWSSCCLYVLCTQLFMYCSVLYSMLWAGKPDLLRSAEKSDFQIFCRSGHACCFATYIQSTVLPTVGLWCTYRQTVCTKILCLNIVFLYVCLYTRMRIESNCLLPDSIYACPYTL
jgi:hypothetical protein